MYHKMNGNVNRLLGRTLEEGVNTARPPIPPPPHPHTPTTKLHPVYEEYGSLLKFT